MLLLYFPPILPIDCAWRAPPDLSNQVVMVAPSAGGTDPVLGSSASNQVIRSGIPQTNVSIFFCATTRSLADVSGATTFTVIDAVGQSFSLKHSPYWYAYAKIVYLPENFGSNVYVLELLMPLTSVTLPVGSVIKKIIDRYESVSQAGYPVTAATL